MKTWQKWLVGISIILASVGTYLAATFDNDASTTASMAQTVDGIKKGVAVIATDTTGGTVATTAQ